MNGCQFEMFVGLIINIVNYKDYDLKVCLKKIFYRAAKYLSLSISFTVIT